MVVRAHAAAGKTGPLTVKDALEQYFDRLEGNGRDTYDPRRRAGRSSFRSSARSTVGALTTDMMHRWHVLAGEGAAAPADAVGEKGKSTAHRQAATPRPSAAAAPPRTACW